MSDETPPPAAEQPAAQPAPPAAAQSAAPAQPVAPAAPLPPLTAAEDKQWASFAHFGGILAFLPALIIFLAFKDRGAQTRAEAKEALNWQITWIAVAIVANILFGIIDTILWAAVPAGAWAVYLVVSGLLGFLGWVPYLVNVVFSIIGGVKITNGEEHYRYPVAVRLIK